jgi:hypothetical protein
VDEKIVGLLRRTSEARECLAPRDAAIPRIQSSREKSKVLGPSPETRATSEG